ncbi:class A beta-lactamase-related serine hydrolase [Streptomyces sp. CB01881]|uniref:serine hydrolase domain-containing protein n=1 Tax=Streptomyces sp. CB01881 TaxID=2078691 RepID=UPI0011DFC95E|nr:serine hydrolase domain-containing protein [Streptomyces sp. CB01881]TYC66616.1 class A beta-lactamase-related serine hydrolase [Streptomyces sp. CB01881]
MTIVQARTPRRGGRLGTRLAAVALAGATVVTLAPTAAVAAGGTGASASGTGSAQERRPPRVDGQQELRDLVERGGTTAALAEIRADGRPRWRGAAGTADLASGRQARPDGRFRIGSVTKTFVSTVLLQLVGEGRLRLDDPVERHLPGVVPNGAAITVRQLLNHTSGLFNFTEDERFLIRSEADLQDFTYGGWRYRDYRPEQLAAVSAEHAPYFAPGQGWHYSNTNYVLAGMIVQKVTGHTWQREVERRIVRPLHLDDTTFPGSETGLGGPHARAYLAMSAGPADITRLDPSVVDAAGNGISTTSDLNRFHAALFGGKLLRPAETAALTDTVATTIEGARYGLGVLRIDLGPGCEPAWGHDGSLPGWSTLLLGSRDGRRQFALSYNPYVGTDDSASGEPINSLVAKTLCDPGTGTGAGAVAGTAPGSAPAPAPVPVPRTLPRTGPDLRVEGVPHAR